MRHLQLHHITHGGRIKTIHGFIDRTKHHLHHDKHHSHTTHHLNGRGSPAVRKDYEDQETGGKLKKRHIKPLHFKI